ncbi:MAG: hypothetical protein ACW99F_07910 [Candidatus Hodarchaeales archaeon]|jgi:hypothetical protein
MRRISIIEIENSVFTLFTPAVVVAASFFLFNLLAWPIFLIQSNLESSSSPEIFPIISAFSSILMMICPTIIGYLLFASRLKVRHVEFKSVKNLESIIILIICSALAIFLIPLFLQLSFFLNITEFPPTPRVILSSSPLELFLIFLNTTLVATIFTELLYRRIAIPLLEDR